MSFRGKKWIWPSEDEPVTEIARELQVSPALARLLINRGMKDARQIRAFLDPSPNLLHSPWQMRGIKEAVERISRAIKDNQKITVHGDYDADGISASVIIVEAIRALGGEVDYYLPSRFDEGYGLHSDALRQFKDEGTKLVITVDCGISAIDEARLASQIGLDLIITDHHQPLEELPEALAVINPLQNSCRYPFKELSGAGVALKLVTALYESSGLNPAHDLLDLAALGTAADVVPLLDENRLLVAGGLEVIRTLKRPGFKALCNAVGLTPERINSHALSFILAPAINAAGRMGEAFPAASLLIEKDAAKAAGLAARLVEANQQRRSVEQQIVKVADEMAAKLIEEEEQNVLTLAADGWHHGVIGIVASRLVDKYKRPVALIALEGDEGRGSARSVDKFDITAALNDSKKLLIRYGGHEQAAGFSVKRSNVEALRKRLNQYALTRLGDSANIQRLIIDCLVTENELSHNLAGELEKFEPLGASNPAPLLASLDWELLSWRIVGSDNRHLKLNLKKNKAQVNPIFFSGADLAGKLEQGRRLDLAFRLKNGHFNGCQTLDLELKDLRYSDEAESEKIIIVDHRYKKDRLKILKEKILEQNCETAVFISTLSQLTKIKGSCPDLGKTIFFSSGPGRRAHDLPERFGRIILFNLPLTPDIIKPFIDHVSDGDDKQEIILLYNEKDLATNKSILSHTLPTAEHLQAIALELLKCSPGSGQPDIVSHCKGLFSFKPAANFWQRAEKILTQTGFIKTDHSFSTDPSILKNWPAALAQSAAYKEVEKLRKECAGFQERMLEDNTGEIAVYLSKLFLL